MSLRNCLLGCVGAILLGAAVAAVADDATTNPSTPAPEVKSTHVKVPAPYNLLPDLSDDQVSKIKDIHSEINEEKKALQQKENDEIEAVLSDDQKKELTDIVSKQTMEKKEAEEARRAKEEADKAADLKNQIDGGATTQPAAGQ
jgi:hypothetical protein